MKHDTDSNATRTRRYGMGLAHHQCDVGKPHEATASGRWPFVVQVALKKALNVPLNLNSLEPDGSSNLRRCSDSRCPDRSVVAYLQLRGVSGEVSDSNIG